MTPAFDPHAWWQSIRKHPYVDSAVILLVLTLGVGSVRWVFRPTVLLSVDGMTRKIHPKADTVGEMLVLQQIALGREDFTTPDLQTPLQRNVHVHITRVTHSKEIRFEQGKPQIRTRARLKANLRPVLVERGFIQESTQTVNVTLYDGVKTSERVVKQKSFRRPLFTLTLFDRETNQPEKVYDLARARKIEMRATGYYVGEKYVPSDTTYLGFRLRRGLVAVDPKVIPLKSRLYVKGYGYAYAADTGGAIKGNRIDLAVKDKKEEAQFNRKKMVVYILEKAKTW